MDVFDLQARLGLDSKAFTTGLSGAKNAVSSFAKIGTAAFIATGAAATAFATSSVKVGSEFDSSMSQLAATMGFTTTQLNATEEEMKNMTDAERKAAEEAQGSFGKLRDFAKEMGSTTMFSAGQASDALNILAMAGYDADKQVSELPGILNMAAAGGLGIADAADYATGIMAGFSKETLDASTVADKLAVIASSAKGDVASFGQGLSTVAGMANTTGQSMQDMTVALGILGNNNFSAAEAGNALSRTLKNLYQPSASAAAAMEELGLSAYDAQGNARPLQDVLLDLQDKVGGMSEEAKNQTLSKIFDSATLKSVPALLNNAGQAWDDLDEKLKDSEGAAEKMAKTMQDNLPGAITQFKSALEGVKIELSDQLSPTLKEFVQLGTDGLSNITKGFQKSGIDGAMAAIGDFLSGAVSMIVSKIPTFVKAISNIIKAVAKGINDNIDVIVDAIVETVPILINGIIETLPLLIDGLFQLILKTAEGLIELIPQIMPQIVELITRVATMILENAPAFIDVVIQLITVTADALLENLPAMLDAITLIINNIVEYITNPENLAKILELAVKLVVVFTTALMEAIPQLFVAITEILQTIADNIINADWQGIMDHISDVVMTALSDAAKSFTKWWNGIKDRLSKAMNTFTGGWSQFWNGITNGAKTVWNTFKNWFLDGWSQFANSWTGKVTGAIEKVTGFFNTVKDKIFGIVESAKNWGVDMINNFISGISSMIGSLGDTISDVANTISDFLHFSLPEKGPLAKSDEWMPDFMDNLAKGIEQNKSRVKNAISDLAGDMSLNVNANTQAQSLGRNQTINFEFRINNVNGTSQEDARLFAQSVSEKIAEIIYRQKAAII